MNKKPTPGFSFSITEILKDNVPIQYSDKRSFSDESRTDKLNDSESEKYEYNSDKSIEDVYCDDEADDYDVDDGEDKDEEFEETPIQKDLGENSPNQNSMSDMENPNKNLVKMFLACQQNNIYNSLFMNWMDSLKEYSKLTNQLSDGEHKEKVSSDESKNPFRFKQMSSSLFQKRVGHPYQNRKIAKRKKPRTSFNRPQIVELEKRFLNQKYLASSERSSLAKSLKMTDAQVKTWFQNRRTKWRRQNAEEKEAAERQKANKLLIFSQAPQTLKNFSDSTLAQQQGLFIDLHSYNPLKNLMMMDSNLKLEHDINLDK